MVNRFDFNNFMFGISNINAIIENTIIIKLMIIYLKYLLWLSNFRNFYQFQFSLCCHLVNCGVIENILLFARFPHKSFAWPFCFRWFILIFLLTSLTVNIKYFELAIARYCLLTSYDAFDAFSYNRNWCLYEVDMNNRKLVSIIKQRNTSLLLLCSKFHMWFYGINDF